MFLHLGGDYYIPKKDLISIIDVESSIKSKYTREFFRMAEEEGFVVKITKDSPKSIVISEKLCKDKSRRSVIFYSPISSHTLMKRAEHLENSIIELEVK